MITFTTISMIVTSAYTAKSASEDWSRLSVSERSGAALAIFVTAIPTLYTIGWLFLPAWGIGPNLRCM